jgi:hypothetical protein
VAEPTFDHHMQIVVITAVPCVVLSMTRHRPRSVVDTGPDQTTPSMTVDARAAPQPVTGTSFVYVWPSASKALGLRAPITMPIRIARQVPGCSRPEPADSGCRDRCGRRQPQALPVSKRDARDQLDVEPADR